MDGALWEDLEDVPRAWGVVKVRFPLWLMGLVVVMTKKENDAGNGKDEGDG